MGQLEFDCPAVPASPSSLSTGQNVRHVLNLGHGTSQRDNLARIIGACQIESPTFVTFLGLGVPVSSISCFKYAFGEFRHSVVR